MGALGIPCGAGVQLRQLGRIQNPVRRRSIAALAGPEPVSRHIRKQRNARTEENHHHHHHLSRSPMTAPWARMRPDSRRPHWDPRGAPGRCIFLAMDAPWGSWGAGGRPGAMAGLGWVGWGHGEGGGRGGQGTTGQGLAACGTAGSVPGQCRIFHGARVDSPPCSAAICLGSGSLWLSIGPTLRFLQQSVFEASLFRVTQPALAWPHRAPATCCPVICASLGHCHQAKQCWAASFP